MRSQSCKSSLARWLRTALLGTAALIATTSSQAQTGPSDVPCEGVGRLTSTPVTVQTRGRSMVVGHGTNDTVEVSVTDCGRRMVIDAPQARIELLRSALKENALEGTVVTDMPAEWSLVPLNPRFLEGKIVATMPDGGKASASVTLKMTESRAPDTEGCFSREDKSVSDKDLGHQVLSEILLEGDRSLPEGYQIEDYVSHTRVGEGLDRVHVHLSHSNDIVPLRADSVSLNEICAGNGWLEPPRWMLNYKIGRATDATYVFVQKIEIETGEIVAQREGVADGLGPDAVRSAMQEANAQLSSPPLGFSAGAD